MARPTTLLRWASELVSGFVGRVEPNEGLKDSGYEDGEAPPAGEHNWLFGLAGDWLSYLDEQVSALLAHDIALETHNDSYDALYAQLDTQLSVLQNRAALKDVVNTFARGQLVHCNDSSEAALAVDMVPGSHPPVPGGVVAVNAWKLIFELAADDAVNTQPIRVFTGSNDSDVKGMFLIATNVVWNIYYQLWEQIAPLKPSTAVIWHYGKLRVVTMAAGSAGWPHWDSYGYVDVPPGTSNNTVQITGKLLAYVLETQGDVASDNNVTATHAVKAGDGFAYLAPIARTTVVPVTSALVEGGQAKLNLAGKLTITGAGTVTLAWPLRLPVGATLGEAKILYDQFDNSYPLEFLAMKVTAVDFVAGMGGIPQPQDHHLGFGTSGDHVATVNFSALSLLTVTAGEQYRLELTARIDDVIKGVQITWTDPGPSNYGA